MNNHHLHFNNLSSAQVEVAHSAGKLWIIVSIVNLVEVIRRLNLAADQQHEEIRIRLAYDRSHTQPSYLGGAWAEVHRNILHYALKLAHEELQKHSTFKIRYQPVNMSTLQLRIFPVPTRYVARIVALSVLHR